MRALFASKPPLSKTGSPAPGEMARSARRGAVGRRRRPEGFRRTMPCTLSHPQTGRNPSASQARHLPLTREAFLAGSARAKGSPLRGELAAPAGLRGFVGFSAAAPSPLCRPIHSSLLTPPPPPPFPKTLQTLHALHKTCPLFAKPLPRLYRTMVETGAKPRYN